MSRIDEEKPSPLRLGWHLKLGSPVKVPFPVWAWAFPSVALAQRPVTDVGDVCGPDLQLCVPFDIRWLRGVHKHIEGEVKVTPTLSFQPHEYYD